MGFDFITMGDATLGVTIIIGNAITVLALWLSRRLLSVTSNHLILSLACSDLLIGLSMIYHLLFNFFPIMKNFKIFCIISFVAFLCAYYANFGSVAAIAVDRYVSVVHPFRYSSLVTTKVVYLIIIAIWSTALLLSTTLIYWNAYTMVQSCYIGNIIPRKYVFFIEIPVISIIWISVFLLYWRIWKESNEHAKRSRKRSSTETCRDRCGYKRDKSHQIVLPILGTFILCWLPYIAMEICQIIHIDLALKIIVYHAVYWIASISAVINPFIYAAKNSNFRQALSSMSKCRSPNHDYKEKLKNCLSQTNNAITRSNEQRQERIVVVSTIPSELDDVIVSK